MCTTSHLLVPRTPRLVGTVGGGYRLLKAAAHRKYNWIHLLFAAGHAFHSKGVAFLIRWPEADVLPALPLLQFSHQLLAMLRNPTVTIPEVRRGTPQVRCSGAGILLACSFVW